MQITEAITDPELGFTPFSVQRTTCRRQNGTSVPAVQALPASGYVHHSCFRTENHVPEGRSACILPSFFVFCRGTEVSGVGKG